MTSPRQHSCLRRSRALFFCPSTFISFYLMSVITGPFAFALYVYTFRISQAWINLCLSASALWVPWISCLTDSNWLLRPGIVDNRKCARVLLGSTRSDSCRAEKPWFRCYQSSQCNQSYSGGGWWMQECQIVGQRYSQCKNWFKIEKAVKGNCWYEWVTCVLKREIRERLDELKEKIESAEKAKEQLLTLQLNDTPIRSRESNRCKKERLLEYSKKTE